MDAIKIYKELIDSSKPFEFVPLRKPCNEKRPKKLKNLYYANFSRTNDAQQDYAKTVQDLEKQRLEESLQQTQHEDQKHYECHGLLDVESTLSEVQLNEPNVKKFEFKRIKNKSLSINTKEKQILDLVKSNAVVVVEGPTGCGKTTQVPQIILADSFKNEQPVNIVVTQPRKIAALSVAKRVCEEINSPLGSLIGFKVGMKATISKDTRLTFCTTGVLLQHLVAKKHMNDFTHVILDEVHERDQELDFLMLLVRKFQRSVSPHVKVVLMSATFNSKKLSDYFCFPSAGAIESAPLVKIETVPNHQVDVYHIEEIHQILKHENAVWNSCKEPVYSKEMLDTVVQLIAQLDELEDNRCIQKRGAVLVFLPGIHEIEDTLNALINFNLSNKFSWKLHVLHSSITRDEQLKAFCQVPSHYRKIILSTNIAESSVTVPDAVYVIDTCLTKQMETKLNTTISCLALRWASKVNCLQRKGRIGRVGPGIVFRLIPKDFYLTLLDEQLPEMLRCPITKLVLLAKMLDSGDPKLLLALALDPPELLNIETTLLILKEAGALLIDNAEGKPDRSNGEITFLGKLMAKLPIDIHLTKLVVLGYIFGVYESCLHIASAMYVRNLFASPFQEKLDGYLAKLGWANGSGSDCIALLNAFKIWRVNKQNGFFERNLASFSEEKWAKDNFIQLRYAREVADLAEELDSRLKHLGLVVKSASAPSRLSTEQERLLLKVVIAGAFYPNYFESYSKKSVEEVARTVGGFDPYSSVLLTNFPLHQPGKLYTKPVKSLLANVADTMQVTFDGSSKIYVQFGNDGVVPCVMPTRASIAVYKAIKLRQTGWKLQIDVLPEHAAVLKCREVPKEPLLNVAMKSILDSLKVNTVKQCMPKLSTKFLQLKITHVESPSKFYCQTLDVKTTLRLDTLKTLNDENADLRALSGRPKVGKIYVVHYDIQNEKLRALLMTNLPYETCKVFLIDIGKSLIVSNRSLLEPGPGLMVSNLAKIPQLALECRLADVGPIDNTWHSDSIAFFSESVIEGNCMRAEVYSVVQSVVCVKITDANSKLLNEELVNRGFACRLPETFLSKENNQIRENCKSLTSEQAAYHQKQQYKSLLDAFEDPDAPRAAECTDSATLRGPFSPLEVKVKHMIRSGSNLTANIEQSSVNSVLLNDDPGKNRFLVASLVQASQNKDNLTLHDTTLMPSIPGLLSLLCMVFAPKIELRTKAGVNNFTGMICGLGCEKKTRHSLYPEHDMEHVFDVEFTMEDLKEINCLRFWLNFALSTDNGEEKPSNGAKDVHLYQKQSQSLMLSLLSKKRSEVVPRNFKDAYCWRKVDKSLELHPAGKSFAKGNKIYPLHRAVLFESERERECKKKKKAMQRLEDISLMSVLPRSNVHCSCCKVSLFSVDELRAHLTDETHLAAWDALLELRSECDE